jgi:micrococcal nuclease
MQRLIWLATLVTALGLVGVGIYQWDRNQGLTKQVNDMKAYVDTLETQRVGMVLGTRVSSEDEMVVVAEAVDGGTFRLVDGRVVRYVGINAPEITGTSAGAECFGEEAKIKNQALVAGKQVRLEKDISEADHYGRLLRYVWLDDVMINQALVREGYAQASAYPPDTYYQDYIDEAERDAQAKGNGLWSACQPMSEIIEQVVGTALSSPIDEQANTSGDSTAIEQPTGCVIKGNISRYSGEKIYHVPGSKYYEQMVIGDLDGEQWFCTGDEAVAAGWRKSTL